jgi:hypothetical protein
LAYEDQVQVQGLICITVDKQDVFVAPIHERIGQAEYDPCVACGHAKEPPLSQRNKRKWPRRSSSGRKSLSAASDDYEDDDDDTNGKIKRKMNKEDAKSEDEDLDLLLSSEEPEQVNSSITGYVDSSQFSSSISDIENTQQQLQLPADSSANVSGLSASSQNHPTDSDAALHDVSPCSYRVIVRCSVFDRL